MSDDALDVQDFMARVQNDKELFFELLNIFIKDYEMKRQELGEAIENKDNKTIEHVAHFLKGSCGNISAGSLRSIFSELEIKGKENNLEGIEKVLPGIDAQYEVLLKFIEELRVKLA